MTESGYPPGHDEQRVRRVLEHYEDQTDEEGVAADEDSYDPASRTALEVPKDLLPKIRELIAKRKAV